MRYEWNGEPVRVEFGFGIVSPVNDKPLYWYNYECLHRFKDEEIVKIPAVRIWNNDGSYFVIANHFGVGIHKLENGGYMDYPHSSLPDDSFVIGVKDDMWHITEFNKDGYIAYEAEREKWQELTYPEEYSKLKRLVEMARGMKDAPNQINFN